MSSSFEEYAVANATTTDYNWIGFVYLFGSSVLWGSSYLPVKHYETGDGMFYQLVVCLAIWTVGVAVHIIRGFPTFYALPILGGMFWATGNVNSVPIIKTIGEYLRDELIVFPHLEKNTWTYLFYFPLLGVGLGLLTWSGIGLITGWATVRFGNDYALLS